MVTIVKLHWKSNCIHHHQPWSAQRGPSWPQRRSAAWRKTTRHFWSRWTFQQFKIWPEQSACFSAEEWRAVGRVECVVDEKKRLSVGSTALLSTGGTDRIWLGCFKKEKNISSNHLPSLFCFTIEGLFSIFNQYQYWVLANNSAWLQFCSNATFLHFICQSSGRRGYWRWMDGGCLFWAFFPPLLPWAPTYGTNCIPLWTADQLLGDYTGNERKQIYNKCVWLCEPVINSKLCW